jgi:hypothetical protein
VIPSKLNDPVIGEKHIMLDHSAYFITTKNENEAHYLTAMLNSSPVRAFTSWTIAVLPVSMYNPDDDLCTRLAQKAKQASKSKKVDSTLQAEIDELVGESYDLPKSDIETLREHYLVLSGQTR